MEPSLHGLSQSNIFNSPYFLAAFGVAAAIGFVLFIVGFFLIKNRIETLQPNKCDTCGATGNVFERVQQCPLHGELKADIKNMQKWQDTHDNDYRELMRRVNQHMLREGRGD